MTCTSCGAQRQAEEARCSACGAAFTPMLIDPLVGRILGEKYTLQQRLAAGSHGAVYAATTQQGSLLAVKVLQANPNKNPQIIKRFQREASVTSQLTSPYVVKVYDAGIANDGLPWIAMELLSGETLAAYIKQKNRLTLPEFFSIFSRLCEALSEAHEKGFLHRDLKPQNVMLVAQRTNLSAGLPPFPVPCSLFPVLLDFGIASVQEEESMTSSGLVHGTPQFMAPEQWEGLRNATPRSDLYSLGLMAYQALSGKMPYTAKNMMGWMRAHFSEMPALLLSAAPDLPQALSDVVMRAISKSAADRFESVRDFYQALTQAREST